MTTAREFFGQCGRDADRLCAIDCGGGLRAVAYDDMPGGTSAGDALEREAIARIESEGRRGELSASVASAAAVCAWTGRTLAPRCGEVLRMLYVERLTLGQAARTLGRSKSTVAAWRDASFEWVDANGGAERVLSLCAET